MSTGITVQGGTELLNRIWNLWQTCRFRNPFRDSHDRDWRSAIMADMPAAGRLVASDGGGRLPHTERFVSRGFLLHSHVPPCHQHVDRWHDEQREDRADDHAGDQHDADAV